MHAESEITARDVLVCTWKLLHVNLLLTYCSCTWLFVLATAPTSIYLVSVAEHVCACVVLADILVLTFYSFVVLCFFVCRVVQRASPSSA